MITGAAGKALVVFAMIAIAGCSKEPSNNLPRGFSPSADPLPTQSTDESLTETDYITLGVPAVDRAWSGPDFTRAAEGLSRLAAHNPRALPRYQSERSGAVFSRITSTQNFEIIVDPSLPISARMPTAMEQMQSLNSIMKTYLAIHAQGAISFSETVELLGASLRLIQRVIPMVEKFATTLYKNDPTYEVRLAGIEQMKVGFAQVVTGTIYTFEDSSLSLEQRQRLLSYLSETLPQLIAFLPAGSRQEIVQRLVVLADDAKFGDLQGELRKLCSQINTELSVAKP
jgi:hypothetical protein